MELSLFTAFLLLIGAITLFRGLCAFFTLFKITMSRLNEAWIEKYGKGSWAIVTGCTEGIGKSFCF